MAASKKKKKGSAAVAPRPQRATVVVIYANRGPSTNPCGYGGHFRRIREIVRELDIEQTIEVVGNGTVGIGTVFPLECTLAETGTSLGHLNWDVGRVEEESCRALASSIVAGVDKHLATECQINPATGKPEPPYFGSGTFCTSSSSRTSSKKKKKKKKT